MSNKDYTRTIIKINRETKEGKLVWESSGIRPTSLSGNEILKGLEYSCKVLTKILRLYQYQYKIYTDEDTYYWENGYRLEFIDIWGNTQWPFPYNRAIDDLYDSVQFKLVNVEGFMDDFLADEEEDEGDEQKGDF